jgi:hypothetical protein
MLVSPVLMLACDDPPPLAPGEFLDEAVDVQRVMDATPSLRLDVSGSPRVVYSMNGALKYAVRTEVAWVKETVGTQCETPSLALDATGRPHIAYFDRRGHDLGYAMRFEGGWTTAFVDTTGDVGWGPSLALDAGGRPHIAYHDRTNGDLKYAYLTAEARWAVDIADSLGWVGWYASLALGAGAEPHIAYWDATNEDLKYATKTGDAWQTTTVDAAGNVGWYASLALGPSGEPQVGYWDSTRDDLKYAVLLSGAWSIEIVDPNAWGYVDLVVDRQGATRIAYNHGDPVSSGGTAQNWMNTSLWLATRQGTGWFTTKVQQPPYLGRSPSLAIDQNNRAHVCYSDDVGYLRYAHVEN